MSTTAFPELEREEVLRDQQRENSRDERARSIDKRVIEQLHREAIADALRLERAMNGPSPLELANQRIAELEQQRDEIAHEVTEWVQDLQAYFPGATTMHDVYLGIETMEAGIEQAKSAGKIEAAQHILNMWVEPWIVTQTSFSKRLESYVEELK